MLEEMGVTEASVAHSPIPPQGQTTDDLREVTMGEDPDIDMLDTDFDWAMREKPLPRCTEFSQSDLRGGSLKSSERSSTEEKFSPTLTLDSITLDSDGSSEPHVTDLLPLRPTEGTLSYSQLTWDVPYAIQPPHSDTRLTEDIGVQESIVEIGAGVSDARNRPGYVGMSEQTVITMSSTTSNNADHFELADIVVRVPSGFRTFGAKRDTAAQINIIAENVSQRFISSEELIESDKECVRGLSKRDCPIKGRFNLTFSINRKDGSRTGPYKAWFYVLEDLYINDSFDALLSEKFVKKYGLLVEEVASPGSVLNPPRSGLFDQVEQLSSTTGTCIVSRRTL